MVDGLWTGEFNANVNNITIGVGVLILRNGRIFGGNATNFLVGQYALDGNRIEGRMEGTHYAGAPLTPMGVIPPEGTHQLAFQGTIEGDRIVLDATPPGQTVVRVKGVLTRRCGKAIFAPATDPPGVLDGLWTGEYNANVNNIYLGHSVLALRKGRVFGGNATLYLVGAYTMEGGALRGQMEMAHYAGDPMTVTGLIEPHSHIDVYFTGEAEGERLRLDIEPQNRTVVRVKGSLDRVRGAEIF